MNLTRSPRRSLSALTLTASALGAALGLGAAPAGAVVPPQCLGSEARFFVCGAYDSFADRTPSQGEVDYWVPKLPAKKSLFISTLGRSLESRALIVEQAYWNYADRLVSDLESSYWEGEILKPDGFRRLQAALYNEVEATPEDLVDWAYHGVVGREATDAERTYWAGVAEAKGAGRMADLLAGTEEVRRTRVRYTYVNELGYFPDNASRDYWAEKLRTGTPYLDVRIAIVAGGYPEAATGCTTFTPPARIGCEPE
jgi:hypothetical protein